MNPDIKTTMCYDYIKDKIHACWIGKNIGGTIGAPYEGTKELLDLQGFSNPKGEILPNDDLDLQLIWLCAMEEVGPYNLDANALGHYWLNYLPAPWNEYGIGKANLRAGIPAPLCGELNNEYWRHSNGAWIRSEIWACLAPGYPAIARRYAFADACIDHGMGEGTVAEQFTATMEALAFFNNDIRAILDQALQAIPQESRVARSVQLAMAGYDAGKDWKTVRNELVKENEDLDWFMAPANLGFVVLGLLYGEGDFKKSVLTAVNCGDDTDCTAATVGAFLGILYGTKGLPADWVDHIGDEIVTMSIDQTYRNVRTIKSCAQFTERILNMIPTVLTANNVSFRWSEGKNELAKHFLPSIHRSGENCYYDARPLENPRYYFEAADSPILRAKVAYDQAPLLRPGESLKVTVQFCTKLFLPFNIDLQLILPQGLTADKTAARIYCDHCFERFNTAAEFQFTATEALAPINRILVKGQISDRHTPILFEIPICAK